MALNIHLKSCDHLDQYLSNDRTWWWYAIYQLLWLGLSAPFFFIPHLNRETVFPELIAFLKLKIRPALCLCVQVNLLQSNDRKMKSVFLIDLFQHPCMLPPGMTSGKMCLRIFWNYKHFKAHQLPQKFIKKQQNRTMHLGFNKNLAMPRFFIYRRHVFALGTLLWSCCCRNIFRLGIMKPCHCLKAFLFLQNVCYIF